MLTDQWAANSNSPVRCDPSGTPHPKRVPSGTPAPSREPTGALLLVRMIFSSGCTGLLRDALAINEATFLTSVAMRVPK